MNLLLTFSFFTGADSHIFVIPDIQEQKHKHAFGILSMTVFVKIYLFMIYEHFKRYSQLPHQVANNGMNCYDTMLSKYPKKLFGTQLC